MLDLFPPFDFARLVNMLVEGAILLVGVWVGAKLALRGERRRVRHDIEVRYASEICTAVPGVLALVEDALDSVDLARQGVGSWHGSKSQSRFHRGLERLVDRTQRGEAEATVNLLASTRAVERVARHVILLDRMDMGEDMLPLPDPALPERFGGALELLGTVLVALRKDAIRDLRSPSEYR